MMTDLGQDGSSGQEKQHVQLLGPSTSLVWVIVALIWLLAKLSSLVCNSHHRLFFPQGYISLRHVPGLSTLPHYLPNGSRFLSESNPTNGFNFSRGRSNPEHSLTCTPRPYLLAQYTEILFGQDHDS